MKKIILVFIQFIFIYSSVYSQECGTVATSANIQYFNSTQVQRAKFKLDLTVKRPPIQVPIQAHVVRTTGGSGGLTSSQMNSVVNTMNSYFANANIEFFQCNTINYIDNSTFYDFDGSQESSLAGSNDVANVVNIYFCNSIMSSGSSLCGYAYFPPSVDRIFMDNSCALTGNTMSHEMGHYLSLYHTHGKTNTGTTDEYVNGSNCTYAGDDICDTPADPNLYGLIGSSCSYSGSATDANGDTYNPDPTNIMSYSLQSCRNYLSTGQYNRVAYSLANERNYLNCSGGSGCSLTTPIVTNNSRCGSGTVDLTASPSTGGTTCKWYQNATGGTLLYTGLTFTTPTINSSTTYYVSTSDGGSCESTTRSPVTASITSVPNAVISNLEGNYCVDDASITLSLTPSFGTTGTTLSGNGIIGNVFDPSVAGVGVHSILYSVTSGGCTDSDGKLIEIVGSGSINPNYSYTTNNLTLNLVNATPITNETMLWDFGNGVKTNQVNPTYTYSNSGIYNVCLTIENTCNEETFCREITVGTPKSINDVKLNNFSIYPNPASSKVYVNADLLEEKHVVISLTNILGQSIIQNRDLGIVNSIEEEFDIRNLNKGMYFLQLDFEGEMTISKFLVE